MRLELVKYVADVMAGPDEAPRRGISRTNAHFRAVSDAAIPGRKAPTAVFITRNQVSAKLVHLLGLALLDEMSLEYGPAGFSCVADVPTDSRVLDLKRERVRDRIVREGRSSLEPPPSGVDRLPELPVEPVDRSY